MRETDEPRPA